MGIASVVVYSDADADTLPVRRATEAVRIGSDAPAASYLNGQAIVDAALAVGADAIHPGYGFLAERAEFAELVEAAGLVFIGPDARTASYLWRQALGSGSGRAGRRSPPRRLTAGGRWG